jgi:hypothetical protein
MGPAVSSEIHRDPHMTFLEAALPSSKDWYKVRNRSTSKKRATQEYLMHSGTIQTVASSAPDVFSLVPVAADFQNTSSHPQHSSNSHQITCDSLSSSQE